MTTFSVRRVITQLQGEATAAFASDGQPPNMVAGPSGFGVAELLWLDGPPRHLDAGSDRTDGGFPLEPPAGGLSSRIICMPGNGEWLRVAGDDDAMPGMHATDTLDLMVVLDGEITLGLDGAELTVRAGDAVIQRGTPHRWRVSGDHPCTYWVTMLRPDPSLPTLDVVPGSGGASGVRRIVTSGGSATVDQAPVGIRASGVTLADLWQTGGRLASPGQGGDVPGPWALEPDGGGVALRWFEMPVHEVGDEGWHTTATIDIDVVLAGRVALELPGGHRAELGVGDVVIQRGTNHRWVPLGETPVRMAAVMIAVP
ncbi:MAG: cupin domain protein [Acidimicrobiales bacterium]|nr:cupin domain protein [Acidimicrobiales bacterium]